MRVSFRVPGYLYEESSNETDSDESVHGRQNIADSWAQQPVADQSVLSALDGSYYGADNMYNYLDMDLIDRGVVEGKIRAVWTAERGLEVIIDYWAPDTLPASSINKLREATRGQLSDGIGEVGFQIAIGGRNFVLVADTSRAPAVELEEDGKLVPAPSRIARAARDGDIRQVEQAIAYGEAIDSTIQGYSGLHLAIIYGYPEAASLLISKGANPNLLVADKEETPLHLCALANNLNDSDSAAVARALLEHGADPSIRTASGYTAIEFAESRKKVALLRVLRENSEIC
jgi:hypothetical protein